MQRTVSWFLSADERTELGRDLARLAGSSGEPPKPVRIRILGEDDVVRARVATRDLALELGAATSGMQRAATIVSELARNIVSYTEGGEIELKPRQVPALIVIRATDSGEGIADIGLVLSGSYKSRTGLGMGLLGSKRLADRFDVHTSAEGTTVEAEVRL